ncbi:MAG: hypothetical protein ACRECQ_12905 [Burkholderiaceae bacterium]
MLIDTLLPAGGVTAAGACGALAIIGIDEQPSIINGVAHNAALIEFFMSLSESNDWSTH